MTRPGDLTPVGPYELGPIPGACEPTRVGYAPPAHLPAARPALCNLDTCSHEDVVNDAYNALHNDDSLWDLSGSSLHIRAICQQVERLDLDLISAQDVVAQQSRVIVHQQTEMAALRERVSDLELLLRTERARLEGEAVMHNETMQRLFARTAECLEQTRAIDKLNVEARTLRAALDTVAGGRRRAPSAQIIDVSDETDVVDVDHMDEPVVSRTVTPRVHVPQMRELQAGGGQ